MSDSFTVISAFYNSGYATTQLSNDPYVFVTGTANGVRVRIMLPWRQIQKANAAGGQSAVQNLFGVLFLNQIAVFDGIAGPYTNQTLLQVPEYDAPEDEIPAPLTGQPQQPPPIGGSFADCTQAMVSPWTA